MSDYRLVRKLSVSALCESWAAVEVSPGGAPSRTVVGLQRLLAVGAAVTSQPEALPRLLARLEALGSTRTVPVRALGIARESLWLQEDSHDTESLRTLLQALAAAKGRLAPNEGFAILLQLSEALSELHGATPAFAHGDVCASTVALTPGGELRLSQPGVAQALGAGLTGPLRAEAHALSPEQLVGPAGPAADCFRLGLVLYELALGRTLLQTADCAQGVGLMQGYTGLHLSGLPSVPEPFATLLTKLLALDPLQRPKAQEVRLMLEQAIRRLGWSTGPEVVAALFERAFPGRRRLATLWNAPGEGLTLQPFEAGLASLAPPPRSSTNGGAPSCGASVPAPQPTVRASPSSQVSIGRVATRKVTLSDLRVLQAQDVSAPQTAAPKSSDSGGIKDYRVGLQLRAQDKVTPAQLEEGIGYAREYGVPLSEALVATAAVSDEDMVIAMGELTHTPSISGQRLDELPGSPEALALISADEAAARCVVPLSLKGTTQLVVAVQDPLDERAIAELKSLTQRTSIVAMRASTQAIQRTLGRLYGIPTESAPQPWMETTTVRRADALTTPAVSAGSLLSNSRIPKAPVRGLSMGGPGATAEARMKEPARLLLEALLGSMVDGGRPARAFLGLLESASRRLGVRETDAGRLWLAAAGVAVANLVAGRAPLALTALDEVATLLGPTWVDLEPLVAPSVDPRRLPVSSLPAALLTACLCLAQDGARGLPSASEAWPRLEPLRPRVPALVLDALMTELRQL